MDTGNKMTKSVSNILNRSVYTIVRSLATMFLKRGMSYAVFSELARAAYIDAATEFELDGRKLSDSRISVITGLSRKEVKRLKSFEPQDVPAEDLRHNRAVRVITAWAREQKYLNSKGKPRLLPVSGESPSLHELVTEFGGGVPTRAVIDELCRVGAIIESKKGYWRLENPAYLPKDSDTAAMNILGVDVPLLIKTINHNLDVEPEEKLFQRKVMYQEIPETEALQFKKYAADESFKLLKKLDKWLANVAEEHADNPTKGENIFRIGVSTFYFEEQQNNNSAVSTKASPQKSLKVSTDRNAGNNVDKK